MRKHILPILLVLLMVLLVGCSQTNDLPQDTEISSSSVGECNAPTRGTQGS